jgi:hypothetical protein
LHVLLVSVFVVAVVFGAWFFGYGLSLIRDQSSDTDLEPQVPDAPGEVPKKDDQEAKAAVQA